MIDSIFQNSLLADAAYIDFGDFTGDLRGTSAFDLTFINDRHWTDSQLEQFKRDYAIFGQYDYASGLSITVFENQHTGEKTIAFRGTEADFPDIRDLLSDLLLTLALRGQNYFPIEN